MIFGRLAWDGPRCAVMKCTISSDVTGSGEPEKEPSLTDAGLGDKRKNLPITYEARLWQSWTILAVSVGCPWAWAEAGILQKDCGALMLSSFTSNSITPRRKVIPTRSHRHPPLTNTPPGLQVE